jgi:hypothetical protein
LSLLNFVDVFADLEIKPAEKTYRFLTAPSHLPSSVSVISISTGSLDGKR